MRHKVREQSYLDPDLLRKARAYEAAQGWTHSAFTDVAYKSLLETDAAEPELVVRRLDSLTEAIGDLRHTVEVLSLAFGRFTKFWCFFLPPPSEDPEARQRGLKTYREFRRDVADRFSAGRRLMGEIFGVNSNVDSRPSAPADGGGGRGNR